MISHNKMSRILIMTAVSAERDAVLRGLQGSERFDVALAGVGPASAAARTAMTLAAAPAPGPTLGGLSGTAAAAQAGGPRDGSAAAPTPYHVGDGYGLVVSAGIGGGFPGLAEVGSLVVSTRIVAADLGAQTAEGGFSSVDELGFGSANVPVDAGLASRVVAALQAAGLPAVAGPVLTVSTATGTAETAAELALRVPGAAAEAMEGFGVAVAAQCAGLPALEIRAISNAVGPRDRGAWRIREALDALQAASSILLEVFS